MITKQACLPGDCLQCQADSFNPSPSLLSILRLTVAQCFQTIVLADTTRSLPLSLYHIARQLILLNRDGERHCQALLRRIMAICAEVTVWEVA